MNDFWAYASQFGWCESASPGNAPPGLIDARARVEAAAEIEALVAHHVFGLDLDELEFILGSFDKVATAETARFGEYLSRRVATDHLCMLLSQVTSAPIAT